MDRRADRWDVVWAVALALKEYDVRQLVWFVDHWDTAAARPAGLREIEIPHGRYLYVLPVGRRPVRYAGYTLVRER